MNCSFIRERLAPLLLATALLVSLPGFASAQQPKKHQATGIVVSTNAARIILLRQFGRNKVRWTFILAPHSAAPADLTRGVRARIYYHDEKGQHLADRWKVIEPPAAAPAAPKPAPASNAAPPASTAPKPAPPAPAPAATTPSPKRLS